MATLQLSSDTLAVTPLSGQLEYNGQLFVTDSTATRRQVIASTAITTSTTNTNTNKIAINIGGVVYYLLASTSAT